MSIAGFIKSISLKYLRQALTVIDKQFLARTYHSGGSTQALAR